MKAFFQHTFILLAASTLSFWVKLVVTSPLGDPKFSDLSGVADFNGMNSDHHYVAFQRQPCNGLIPCSQKKHLLRKTKKNFAAGRQLAIKSTYFMPKRIHLQTWHSSDGHTFNQIDHCLIDGRHFSDVIDVMVRRGANIDSDHILVVIKLRARICRASNTKPQQLRRFAVDRLKDRDVASQYSGELESELQSVQATPKCATIKLG
jgi:hypothetical protein